MLNLARGLELPVIIHCRDSEEDVLKIAREYNPSKAVVHCFSSSRQYLEQFLDLGFNVSFTANITYKKAQDLRELIKLMPKDRLMLETDCPFLAAQAVRGQRNEPTFLKFLVEAIAELRNETFEEIAEYTTENAKKFFNLKI